MLLTDMNAIVERQRAFFRTGVTLNPAYRIDCLKRLRKALLRSEGRLQNALKQDLGKCSTEAYMAEIGLLLGSLREAIGSLKRWSKPRRVGCPLAQFPAKCRVVPEPYGVTLVMSPWNYPLLLALDPLIASIAAGNTCVLKPSELAPATAEATAQLLGEVFKPDHVAVVQGGPEVCTRLLEQRFDYIFFTGGTAIGKIVMKAAAEHLTPLTLELGGKSPCIVDVTADVRLAARRIAFGKVLNAGQTCVAPDYALVHESVLEPFTRAFREEVQAMLGKEPLAASDYTHIVNKRHFDRLMGLMDGSEVLLGGKGDAESLRIEPTLLGKVSPDSPCMQQEIFGPILPLLPFRDLSEAEDFVLSRPRPLACYIFTSEKSTRDRLLSSLHFGGGCINDTVVHLAVPDLPFGGVGDSGMGAYHGKAGFDTFTHYKSILQRGFSLDLPFRYQPYTTLKRFILRLFLR